jgi:uncharacterized protein
MSESRGGIEILDAAECDTLLRSTTLGRIAIKLAEDLAIFPVYYLVFEDDIVFLTTPGTKLSAAVLKTKVAFEVDGPGWSVLVRGHAEEIRDTATMAKVRSRLGKGWPTGDRDQLVRILTEQLTGRRLP